MKRSSLAIGVAALLVGCLGGPAAGWALEVTVANLVTDDQTAHPAVLTDTALVNPWGVSQSGAGSPFWVSDNGSGQSTLYAVDPTTGAPSKLMLNVSIPGAGSVTGQAFAGGAAGGFNSNLFLFASEDGTLSGWRGSLGTTAEVLALADPDHVYKGAAYSDISGNTYLYAANFRAGTIDVLKGNAGAPDLAGRFTDPGLPSGYAPFNIENLGGMLYVTYALQDANKHDDVAGAGHGFVSVFDLQGNFQQRLVSNGDLDSPWGLALAPTSFAALAGDLLVGNFGDGKIHIYNRTTGALDGVLTGPGDQPLEIDGLWGLIVGSGTGNGGSADVVYFTAGPDGETHGLFGALAPVPEPSSASLLALGLAGLARRRAASIR